MRWVASTVEVGVLVTVAVGDDCDVAVGVAVTAGVVVVAGVVVAAGTVPLSLDNITTGKKILSAACRRIQPVSRIANNSTLA
jgi:hypothetical protein